VDKEKIDCSTKKEKMYLNLKGLCQEIFKIILWSLMQNAYFWFDLRWLKIVTLHGYLK